MHVEATSADGTAVTYEVTVHDDRDPSPSLSCEPTSGSTFPLGGTEVSCVARDSAGHEAFGGFTITVADTTPPTPTAALVATHEVGVSSGKFRVQAICSDTVDSAAVTQAQINGVEVTDGQLVHLQINPVRETLKATSNDVVKLKAPSFALSANCSDFSGNSSSAEAVPEFRSIDAPDGSEGGRDGQSR
jgi:HYR domain